MLKTGALIAACALLAACDRQEPAAPAAPAAPSAAAPAEAPGAPTAPTHKPAPPGAMAYIIEPADGAKVTNPVRVVFGLKGFGVAPAGVERNDASDTLPKHDVLAVATRSWN